MGGSQSSPRTVSVENHMPVQVSEAALRRAAQAALPDAQPQTRSQATPPQRQPPPQESRAKYNYQAEEDYWINRIERLEKTHQAIHKKMGEEYEKALSETTQLFKKTQSNAVVGKLPPCQAEKKLVLECYQKNSSQTLLCSQLVNSFNECVSNSRYGSTADGA